MTQPVRAQDIRRGNLLKFQDDDSIVCVLGTDADELGITVLSIETGEEEWIEIEKFAYILLTKSILEKCEGIKYNPSRKGWVFEVGSADYVIEPGIGGGYTMGVDITDGTAYFIWDIEHLHTLQNIMSLLGKELTVKL